MCMCFNNAPFPVYEKHGSTYNFHLYVGETDKKAHTHRDRHAQKERNFVQCFLVIKDHTQMKQCELEKRVIELLYVCVRAPATRARHLTEYDDFQVLEGPPSCPVRSENTHTLQYS